MKSALIITLIVVWGLWFGGTISTFVFAKYYFAVFPHDVAGESASAMFDVFAKYELVLAGVSLLLSGVLLAGYPKGWTILLLLVMIMACGMVVAVALGFIPAMDRLRLDGQQHTPGFIKLHVKSMIAMSIQSVLLLIVGVLLPVGGGIRAKK
jgi:hypothetical protein